MISPRPAPPPVDPTTNPHLQGVFAPTTTEIDVDGLRIDGELPAEIDGDYVRNGPNPRFTPIGGYLYPIDGDGMLHRVRFRDGGAGYTNRFVRTPAVVAEEAAGRALWPGLMRMDYRPGADQVGPDLAGTVKDLPGINVVRHAGRLLALAESANPFLMSPELATIGRETFCGTIPVGITAHPKVDPAIGDMVVFCYQLEAPFLTWAVIGPDGATVRPPTPVAGLDRPAMIHDMAITDRYVVVVVAPFYFDPAGAATGGSLLSWRPDDGTRIALIPRDGGPVRWAATEGFWLWHTANAHDRADGQVVLDFARWSAPGGLVPGVRPAGGLARMVIDPGTGRVRQETLVDRAMEFPRIDDRAIAADHRQIATSLKGGDRALPSGDADTLGWFDAGTGSFATWDAGDLSVGEQCFVPAPGDPDGGHGWWLCIATDRTDLTSRLLVIPAADPGSGPVATVHLPQRVPAGLHGAWLPTQE